MPLCLSLIISVAKEVEANALKNFYNFQSFTDDSPICEREFLKRGLNLTLNRISKEKLTQNLISHKQKEILQLN